MKLFGVILNYKTADMTLGAATALARALEHVPDSRFAIVDNDSQDGSYEKLKSAVAKSPFRDRCTVLASGHNGGFGSGNNFAIRQNLHSDNPAEYYLLLNSDAVPSEMAIKRMYDFMTSHPDAGICGAYVHGPDGEPHHTAFRFPTAFSELEEQAQTGPISKLVSEHVVALEIPDHTTEVPWTAAVCMMLRRETVQKIGLFDETFFLYYEETDLCRRARQAGYKVYYVREADVSHIGSVSTGMKRFDKPMPLYWFEARKHYFRKHHGDSYSMLADVMWLAGRSVCALRRVIDRRVEERRPHFTRDFIKFNFAPSLARK
ncbi:MAG TPA: glycosyltransferase family 2 protein [Polyangiales bacterium]|nr:glycosyltransferase family 2 protein [Polyangiales bacterium]